MTTRTSRRVAAVATAALLASAALQAAQAQTPPDTATVGSWLVSCVDPSLETARCEMTQRVVDDAGTIQILGASLVAARDTPPTEIAFTTPLGVWLEPGALLALSSGQTRPLEYDHCTPGGCVLRLALDDELRAALEAQSFAEFRFADRLKQPLAAPVSLDGFADAVALLEEKTAPPKPRGIGAWFNWFGE